ncbi:MAG TPA: hypothetical protein VG479_11575 [Gaiellaceae bacterium]|jgi:hypothetical protein|nr:hypothetical protein [Gaiellaceae bacterium]
MNPLDGVFGESWDLFKAHWQHLVSIALAVYIVVAGLSLLLAFLLGWFGAWLGALIGFVGWYWLQGTLIEAVSDVRDGRADQTVSETFGRVWPRLGAIIVAGILLGLAIGIGLLLLIVPGLYLLTIWVAVIPAVVLENRGIIESFGRSRDLVRGHGWNVFGVIILTILLLIGISIVVGVVLSPLDEWLESLVGRFFTNVVVGPFVVVVWTLVYYRLRAAEQPEQAAAPASEPAA